ncbi:MAG: RNA polymerase sigma factor SigJ [Pseudonocardiaceae bacterium]
MADVVRAAELAEHGEFRRYLIGVAYRLLGSVADAEDVVQEALARWYQEDKTKINNSRGWLTVVVSRIALDQLRSARRRREEYVGPWLPEPIVETAGDTVDPAEKVIFEESVHMAMLVVLESLSPAERAVFVLREVFNLPYEQVAKVVGRSRVACRQLDVRARRYVRSKVSRFEPDQHAQKVASTAFRAACASGDLVSLIQVLDHDVVVHTDGGGVVTAARRPIVGAERVANYLLRVLRKWPVTLRPATVNGTAGIVAECKGKTVAVASLAVAQGRIAQLDLVVNPDKFRTAAPNPDGTPTVTALRAPNSAPELSEVR